MAEEKQKFSEGVPKALQGGDIETEVKSMKKHLEDKMLALKDLATMETRLPISARLRHRLLSIREMASAQSLKIDGDWITTPPQIHISQLEGKKLSNDKAEIKFNCYEVNKDGNKVLFENTAEVTLRDGAKMNRVTSSEYRIAFKVTEVIEMDKVITRTVLKTELRK